RVVDPADYLRHRVHRVQTLVGVSLPGYVRVGRHLPAGQVDGLQAGLDLLHGLVAGQRTERVHVVLVVQQRPQPLGAHLGQGLLFLYRAAELDDIGSGVGPLRSRPAWISGPASLEVRGLAGRTGRAARAAHRRPAVGVGGAGKALIVH